MQAKSGAQQYQQINQQSTVQDASPHKLIQMLMQGALDKLHIAKGHMQNGNTEPKCVQISICISIIDGLQASLDKEQGGEVAQNLDNLYTYMMEKLVYANLHDDVDALDEVANLMRTVKDGWDQISPDGQAKDGSHDGQQTA